MDYRSTLNLPDTKFKMKANLAQREPEFLAKWEKEHLYEKVQQSTKGRPAYILHDGPPYANGHIHIGHALNKILKDIILRSKRMSGHHCSYIPGWDCHGLPIEHNVDKELGEKKKVISKLAFRNACRTYAGKWIKAQRDEFKRLGVLGDWENPYLTIDYRYEAAIAREFNQFLISGAVVRSKKPVHWCSSCATALAEAEVDYADHTSYSIFVKFKFAEDLGDRIPELAGETVSVVIWTTTPWTLPANLAVALHQDFTYAAVKVGSEVLIVAEELIESVMKAAGVDEYSKVADFPSAKLEGLKCRHPFIDRESLIVFADYVTLDTGSGCVHTAPGHGREDYITGLKYGLEVLSPVDNCGVFTSEAGRYAGMKTTEANSLICDDLRDSGALVAQAKMSHSFPHCWRCKKPVMFRATEQWFISMDENDLRKKALEAIETVNWTPKWGMERIYGMVESRPDWCLSRQRAWGVPITAILCSQCGTVANTEAINKRIDELFLKEGADAWFSKDVKEFTGELTCQCGSQTFQKEEDILDVWFDSGTSHAAVLEDRPELDSPADLYLEGSDQHRGWFQSSLIASVGTRGRAPYKGVLTHGFVVDSKGKKMSKSVGNVVAPEKVINKYGAEILRLWVASEDYRDEVKISDEILGHLSDAYRKIRNTIRYLLGNLNDFNPATDVVAYDELTEIDKWALSQFEQLRIKIMRAYETFEFHSIFQALQNFCVVTMSSFYLDIQKDRLYTSAPKSVSRRAAQSVLYDLAEGLLRLMAPVLAFTVADAWEYLPESPDREQDPALAAFPAAHKEYVRADLDEKWEELIQVRKDITKALEVARAEKVIGHSLEARVSVKVPQKLEEFLADKWETLQNICIVSELVKVDALGGEVDTGEFTGVEVLVEAASGEKCERCWTRSQSVGLDALHPVACERCVGVLAEIGFVDIIKG
nr:isoleucine--tRNA ligase [Desulfobulbaceae bacterium]